MLASKSGFSQKSLSASSDFLDKHREDAFDNSAFIYQRLILLQLCPDCVPTNIEKVWYSVSLTQTHNVTPDSQRQSTSSKRTNLTINLIMDYGQTLITQTLTVYKAPHNVLQRYLISSVLASLSLTTLCISVLRALLIFPQYTWVHYSVHA